MKPKPKQDQNDGIANPGFNVDVISSDKLRDDLQAQTNYRENASPVVQNRQAAIELQQSKPNFDDPEAGHRVTYLELRPSSIEVHHYTYMCGLDIRLLLISLSVSRHTDNIMAGKMANLNLEHF